MPKTNEKKLAYLKQYDRERTMMLSVKLNRGTDADIIDHLSAIDNRAGYIKELIRADMAKLKA